MSIYGEKGGKGGGGSQRAAREAPNTLRSTSKARVIDAIAEGEVVGLANGLESVFLDGTPLQNEDGSYNFSGVTVHTRNGEPDQAHIPGFPAVETAHAVSVQVTHATPVVRTISNLDADAVRVTVELPALTKQNTENGDLNGSSVAVAIDVRAAGANWVERKSDIISGKTTSPYQRSYRVPLSGTGPWDVRVRRVTEDNGSATLRNDTYWASYTEVIDAKLQYPNTALIGLEVDAQQFGSQIPSRSYDIKGLIVRVPSNYDPESREYTGLWDGSFKLAWTDNPAWCFLDLATSVRYGAGLESVDKWGLYQIAQYCDELVPDGYGGQEPRFTFNTVLSSREEAITVLDTLASAFRGMTYWGANTVMPVADMPGDPVKLVIPANVIDGEFEYSGTALKARHSVALVSWNDPSDNYRLQVEVVEDSAAVQALGWKQLDVTAVGCTSRGQAHRLGKWMLYSERAETETVTYQASVDHADVRPGDIIKLSDPTTAGARLGGRVIEPGTQTLMLDAVPEDATGSDWYLDVILPTGGIERREVQAFDGDQVALVNPLSAAPIRGAVWQLSSQSVEPRQFRVLSVTEQEAATFQISALEHDPTKFARVEQGLALPDEDYTLIPTGPVVSPINISAQAYTYLAGGSEHQGLTISWTPSDDARVVSYIAEVQGPNDVGWRTGYTGTGSSFDLFDAAAGEWMIRVRGVTGTGTASPWVALTTNIAGLLAPTPPDSVDVEIGTFTIALNPSGLYPGMQWEFWRATTALAEADIEANAVRVAVASNLTDTELEPGTTYYYWIRGANAYGVSDWYPVQATTNADASKIMQVLSGEIRETHLYSALGDRIELIDGPEGLEGSVDARVATERQERTTADNALAQNIETMGAQIDENVALIEQEATTRAAEDGVLAQQIDTVQVQLGDEIASVEQQAQASYDEAAGRIDAIWSLSVDVNGNVGGIVLGNDGETIDLGIRADRLYIVDPDDPLTEDFPFIYASGALYLREAMIQSLIFTKLTDSQGSLVFQDGKLQADYIAVDQIVPKEIISSVMVNGRPTYAFREDGSFELNASTAGGRVEQDGDGMRVYDSNGQMRVRIGDLT